MKKKKEKVEPYHCWSCGFVIQQALKPENCPECDSKDIKPKPKEDLNEDLEE